MDVGEAHPTWLAGAAVGLLAGWLAKRLVDKRFRPDRKLPFEPWLILAGIVGILAGMWLSEGFDEVLLVLKTYGLLVLALLAAGRISMAIRRPGPRRLAPSRRGNV